VPPDSPFPLHTAQLSDEQLKRLQYEVTHVRTWLDMKLRAGRYSFGFMMELVWHCIQRRYNVHAIYDEIGWLEEPGTRRGITKPATPFKAAVLRGLWHKHHHQAASILENLRVEMQRRGVMENILLPHYGRYLDEVADQIAHAMTIGAYESRARDGRMTGDWIVYEPQVNGSNYYLTLGRHEESDEVLRARVEAYRGVDERIAAGKP
jgi:hypothetical protein